jgi:hypothetical protein
MKKINLYYWITTGLFGAFMLSSAIPNILSSKEWVVIFEQLGYPLYMLPFLGVAKLLGVIVLLIPGFNRMKEWAYAGFFFDLVGATYSALTAFGFDPQMLVMLVPFVLGTLSYVFHHKKLKATTSVS